MKTGKLGLKTLKRIQGKVNKGIQPFAHFKIGNKKKVPVNTIQKLRNRPENPLGQTFTSVKRSTENSLAISQPPELDLLTVPTASIPGTNGYEAATPLTPLAHNASL